MPYDKRHGGAYDRGSADSYYGRRYDPHKYEGAPYATPRIEFDDLSPEDRAAYRAGWDDNEEAGNFKDWG